MESKKSNESEKDKWIDSVFSLPNKVSDASRRWRVV